MNDYREICISLLLIFIFICIGNASAPIDINKAEQLDSKGYKLCQSDTDSEDQSDVYQEPTREEDESSPPAEIIKQPDENDDPDAN